MSNGDTVRVREIMQDEFIELEGVMTVSDAINAMKQANASVLIVKKRNPQDEYGIVQLSDIAKRVLARDRSPARVNIYEIMTKPVISVSPNMDVRYCSRLFQQFGLASVPVIENDQVVGIVGYRELVFSGMGK